jgi:hypothetical protein
LVAPAGLIEINALSKEVSMRARFSLMVGLLVSIVFLGLLQAGPGAAQGPAQAPAEAPADAVVAAKELVTSMKLADQLKTLLPIIMQALKPAIVQNRPEVERDYDALLPLMLEVTNQRIGEYIDVMATIYARNFTADELRQVAAFYQTPTGRKMLEKLPALTQESMMAGQRFGQALSKEFEGRIKDELRKKGHNI